MTQKILSQIHDKKAGFFKKYMEICVGNRGLLFLLYFELVTVLFRNLPGAIGLLLRSVIYRYLFKSIGKKVVFGTNVIIRNPKNISIGDRVIIDDNCVLDAKGEECEGIVIGENTFVSRNVILGSKNGGIKIGKDVSIGPNSTIHSVDDSKVTIGDYTVIAAYCYIIGGPDYKSDRTDIPMVKQGFLKGKGIDIKEDVWLGADVHVLDGAKIGKGAIVGAKALVKGDIPDYTIAVGIPAVVKGNRKGKKG